VNVNRRLLVVFLVVLVAAVAAGFAVRDSGSDHDGESAEAVAAETGGESEAEGTGEEAGVDGDRGGEEGEDGEKGDEDELFEDPGGWWLAQREAAGGQLTTLMFRRAKAQAGALTSSQGTWTDVGPTNIGGRITDLVVDPSGPNTIYVAAAGGGIWKSTDEGSTFTTAWPDSNAQAIGALARGSDGRLWAGTGEANPPGGGLTYFGDGIYSSDDGGKTWQNRGLTDSGSFGRIVVDPTNPNRIFAAAAGTVSTSVSQRGIYRSTDGGQSWQQVLAPPDDTTGGADIAIDPSNPNRVFATLWDHHRNNGARTYGGDGSGLYRSTNGGDTWTRLETITGALPTYDTAQTGLTKSDTLGRIGVAVAPSNPNRVYVVYGNQTGADKGFLVSNDGGTTFTAGGRAGGNSGFEWWFGRLWVDPANADRLFNADVSLRLSTNGGTSWTTSGSVHADQHAMAYDPNAPNRVYLGNDGGVYHSDGNGSNNTWIHGTYEPWNQGYHIAVAADDPGRIAVGLQDNGSNRTWTNGASAPTPPYAFSSYGGGDGHYVAIDQSNHNYYFQCSQGGACGGRLDTLTTSGTLGCSSKHGVRWTTDAPLVLDPNNQAIVYIGGEVIDRSTNHCQGGFTPISPGAPDDLPGPIPPEEQDTGLYANLYGAVTAIGPAKDALPGSAAPNNYAQTIYAGTDTGFLWKTSDAGAHWTKLTGNGLPTRWVNGIAVDPDDAGHAYVIFSGYREGDNAANIWETTDGGANWTNLSGNLPNAPLDSVVLDKRDGVVIVSGDLGVFFLRRPIDDPNSITWTRLGTNLPNTSIQDIKIQASTNTLYAMSFGRGVQTIPLPPAYSWGGFQAPTLEPPALNSAIAFTTVAVKFSLGANYGFDILADGYPQSVQINCSTLDPIDGTSAPTLGGLGYEAGNYKYLWRTDRKWAGTCRQFVLKLADGTTHVADFRFR
jgi:photosystem II stability/assembly factor-like uncharacterized protein